MLLLLLQCSVMNHVYKLLWSHARAAWVVVGETARSKSKTTTKSLLISLGLALPAATLAGPSGGEVISGSATIDYQGSSTVINQASSTASLNWQSFNVAANEQVTFNQPSASAIAVNRILDTNGSRIMGRLNANGQVYLINPNGIIFGTSAQVNVGALVASTLDYDASYAGANSAWFEGSSKAAVTNLGDIASAEGGYVAFIAHKIDNSGTIVSPQGSVAMGAGSKVKLSFDQQGLVNLEVEQSLLDSLANNSGLIQADGGMVLMKSGAKDSMLASVVNNTGVIEANTVQQKDGKIILLAGMQAGTAKVAGELSAIASGIDEDGGFIETSGAIVNVADSAMVSTHAAQGETGTWLIDPFDYTIANNGGNMTGAQVTTSLQSNNLIIETTNGNSGSLGNLYINDNFNWSANTLTLKAQNDIIVKADLDASGTGGLVLEYGLANVAVGNSSQFDVNSGRIRLMDSTNSFATKLGSDGSTVNYTIVNGLGQAASPAAGDLRGMGLDLDGHYVLGGKVDGRGVADFVAIGNSSTPFTGTFNGLGNSITHMTMSGSNEHGLFGKLNNATISNINFDQVTVSGSGALGVLAGIADNSKIRNVKASNVTVNAGSVTDYQGGLVGQADNSVFANIDVTGTSQLANASNYAAGVVAEASNSQFTNVHSAAVVSNGKLMAGGLVALSDTSTYSNVSSKGSVTGEQVVGGIIGKAANANDAISVAWSSAQVNGATSGGLVGELHGDIEDSYATGNIVGSSFAGGLVALSKATASVAQVYASGSVNGDGVLGGLVADNAGTISQAYAAGSVDNLAGSASQIGGLVGTSSGTVTDSFWHLTNTGQSTSAAGTGLTSSDAVTASNYTGFDFTNDWNTTYGLILPTLKAHSSISQSGSDYTITPVTSLPSGGAIGDLLVSGNVTINSASSGHVQVFGDIDWSANKLTLAAQNNVGIYGDFTATAAAELSLQYGLGQLAEYSDSYIEVVGATVSLPDSTSNLTTQFGSDGSVKNYTVISSLGNEGSATTSDLQGMKGDVSLNYALGANIDATATSTWTNPFVPVGTWDNRFSGDLLGMGHTISNLSISDSARAGLFAAIEGATVQDLNLTDISVSAGNEAGAVAGNAASQSTIRNVRVINANITTNSNSQAFKGGIVGSADSSNLYNVHVSGNTTITDSTNNHAWAGGITGSLVRSNLYDSSSTVDFVDANVNYNGAGGLVGSSKFSVIKRSWATGDVKGAQTLGGLVGRQISSTIEDSWASGDVTGQWTLGGLVGYGSKVYYSNAFGDVTASIDGYNFVGGLVGQSTGFIKHSNSSGLVTASDKNFVGGLVGENDSHITLSTENASSVVAGTETVGVGLGVGYQLINASTTGLTSTGTLTVNGASQNKLFGINYTDGVIRTVQDLKHVSYFPNQNYTLANNLDMTGVSIASLSFGSGNAPAAGQSVPVFDGQNYTISNLNNTGLFSNIQYATVKDLTLDNWTINHGGKYGALADQVKNATVANITLSNATLQPQDRYAYKGAMLGEVYDSSLSNLQVTGTSVYDFNEAMDRRNLSGLVGYMSNSSLTSSSSNLRIAGSHTNYVAGLVVGLNNSTISHSFATGDMDVGGSAGVSVGGLVTEMAGANASISHSWASGDVTGGRMVGGLVADMRAGAINDSYATGDVSVWGATSTAGGLIGQVSGGSITDSYATGVVDGKEQVGGLVGYFNNGSIANSETRVGSSVNGTNYVGGLIGQVGVNRKTNATLSGSTSVGAVTVGNNNSHVGGLIGLNYGAVTNSVSSGNVQVGNSAFAVGGLIGFNQGSVNNTATNSSSITTGSDAKVVGRYMGMQAGDVTGAGTTGTATINGTTITAVNGYGYTDGQIATPTELDYVRYFPYHDFTLSNDIDMSGISFVPIPEYGYASLPNGVTAPVFNGQNYTISNLTTSNGGLFSSVFHSTVKNLKLDTVTANGSGALAVGAQNATISNITANDVDVIGNGQWTGGLVGSATWVTFNNVHVTGQSTVDTPHINSNRNLGGLVGRIVDSTITASSSSADISYAEGNIGGLVGEIVRSQVSDSHATGDISGYLDAGGLVGTTEGGTSAISDSWASGKVTGYSRVGGLVGFLKHGSVTGSYATGDVTGSYQNIGGLIGYHSGVVSKSYATGDVRGQNQVGGLSGGLIGGNITKSYASGDVTDTSTGVGSGAIGGLVGMHHGHFSESYAKGLVTGTNAALTGGLVGDGGTANQQTHSYWDIDATGQSASHIGSGIATNHHPAGLTSAQMSQQASYVGFDFSNDWYPLGGGSTPTLTHFPPVLAVTVTNLQKHYDQGIYAGAYTVTYGGFLPGDSAADITGSLAFSGSALTATAPGTYAIEASGVSLAGYRVDFTPGTLTIDKADLEVTGLAVADRTYDTTITASISGTPIITAIAGESVILNGTASAVFNSAAAGQNKAVTVSGLSISGADAGNYNLVFPATLTADVAKADLVVNGFSASDRAYDTSTSVSLSGSASITPLAGDQLTLSGTAVGNFADKHVGNNKPVQLSGLSLSGAAASNYRLVSAPSLVADVTKVNLNLSGIGVKDKRRDKTAFGDVLGRPLVSPLQGDQVLVLGSGLVTFASTDVAENIPVTISGYRLGGADGGNYDIIYPTGLVGEIKLAENPNTKAMSGLFASISAPVSVPLAVPMVSTATSMPAPLKLAAPMKVAAKVATQNSVAPKGEVSADVAVDSNNTMVEASTATPVDQPASTNDAAVQAEAGVSSDTLVDSDQVVAEGDSAAGTNDSEASVGENDEQQNSDTDEEQDSQLDTQIAAASDTNAEVVLEVSSTTLLGISGSASYVINGGVNLPKVLVGN